MADNDAKKTTSETSIGENLEKLSNKQRRALWKKQKRKAKRQVIAIKRDAELLKEEEARTNSPSYQAQLKQDEWEAQAELLRIADESRRQHELWLWHEELFAEKLKRRKEQEEKERLQKLEIERKIKEEWEERQKKEKEEEEERRKKREKQEELLRQAREAENKDGDWHNPLAPVRYGQERQIETCPFFAKVGACRFGDRCSRGHPLPDSGHTLMFSTMFKHFQLDQGLCEEYDTDIVLEYEDSEVYQKFHEFFEDTLPEFKASGQVTQFKVCCNYQAHLRGNVYVSYSREDEALKAYLTFNARWYGGKQLTARFVNIPSWRRAICGLYAKGRCPKGKECNFLHVFKNPSSEFNMADRDMESFTPHRNSERRHNSRRARSRSRDRKRRHSRSPLSRKYRHSRSRSRERLSRYRSISRRSRSRSRERCSRSRSKDRSRSSRYRSRSGSRERYSRSRSKDRSRSSRYRSRSGSRERYSRSRSKDRSRSSRYRSRSGSPQNDLNSHRKRERKTKSNYSRDRSRERPEKKTRKRDDNLEEVWVEKTVDNNSNENSAEYKSRSSSREGSMSRSSSVISERKKHKKKHKHLKDMKD